MYNDYDSYDNYDEDQSEQQFQYYQDDNGNFYIVDKDGNLIPLRGMSSARGGYGYSNYESFPQYRYDEHNRGVNYRNSDKQFSQQQQFRRQTQQQPRQISIQGGSSLVFVFIGIVILCAIIAMSSGFGL